MPEEMITLEVKFIPREIGKYESQVRLFIADNPYENLIIDLKSEAYAELIVLDGLELTNTKLNSVNERRESNAKSRRSSKPNSTTGGCKKYKNIKIIIKNIIILLQVFSFIYYLILILNYFQYVSSRSTLNLLFYNK